MTTAFPVALDALVNPTPTDDVSVVSHSGQHADANDAIEALEAKVGIDSSAVTSSLDYLLKNTSSLNPGHKHTGASVSGLDTTNFTAGIIDTDGTLAANSDTRLATQKAVKTYTDQLIAAANAVVYKGVIDCSANPNYPAADAGWFYVVSVAGKIGGASGLNVEAGDMLICTTDGTASGNQATVGAFWNVVQKNLDGVVIGPASSTDGNFTLFDGTTGKLIKNSAFSPSSFQVADADLTALAALGTTGYGVRTAANTWALRTFTVGKGITITNADGVAGATAHQIDLSAAKMDWTGDHSWLTDMFRLKNPAGTFLYKIQTSAIGADRNVTIPLMVANGEFVIDNHTQTLTNKTLTSPVINTSVSGTAFLDEDDMASNSATKLASQQSIKAYTDNRALYKAPVSGRYYANHSTAQFPGTASVFGATGWVFFSAHNLSFPTTIDKVSFEVTTAVAASNGRVGIYSDVDGVPTALVRDCGTISTASTGVKEITGLAQAMPAGRFWIGTQFDSAVSVRSWGTAVGHDINAEIGMPAFNNPVTANIDIFTTYAGGLSNPATVLQFNGVDTLQTCWRS